MRRGMGGREGRWLLVAMVLSVSSWALVTQAAPYVVKRIRPDHLTRPAPRLQPCHKAVADLVADFSRGQKVLTSGRILEKDGKPDIHVSKLRTFRTHPVDPGVIFRMTIQGPSGPVTAIFKPFQTRYRDGYVELAACQLAAFLGVRQPPCGERTVSRAQMKWALAEIPKNYRGLLKWDGDRLRGYVRLWAGRFRRRIGRLTPSRVQMLLLAHEIRPGGACASLPICRDLGNMLLADFVVGNNDRRFNVGSILLPGGKVLLFPIDWGDALSGGGQKGMRRKVWMRKAFYAMRRFDRKVVARLKKLDEPILRKLYSDSSGHLLVRPFYLSHSLAVIHKVLARIDALHARLGDRIYFP